MKARIKTRFATAKETAHVLGVSKSRFKLLERLAHSDTIFKVKSERNSIGKDAGSPIRVHAEFARWASDSAKSKGKVGQGKRKVTSNSHSSGKRRSRGKVSKASG
jgi:hypothetical protein